MQPQEESSARCRSSSDTPTVSFESKGVDFRRFRHVDPRYSVYRWDCGSYPYFKAPVPTSSPCSGVQPAFTPNNVGYPGHAPTAPDIFCDGRRDCYGGVVVGSGSGQDFIPQPQRCICPDTHDPRYHPQLLGPPDAVNLEPRPVGCLCCGQHVVNPRGPINHPRHVDSVRLFPPPVYRTTVGPDVVHVYPSTRELIDAPVQCLPSSETLSIGSGLLDKPPERRAGCAGPLMEGTTCGGGGGGQTSSSSAAPCTKESVSTENRDIRRSNGRRPERETDASFESSCCSVKTEEEIRADTMTNVGSVSTDEPKRTDQPTGKISDAKITPTRSTSKVTPLYGLPSWWGDEPEPDFDQQRKYNHPTVTSSSSFDSPNLKKQSEHSDRVTIATTRTSLSNSNPPHATTKGCSLGPTGVPIATDYSLPPITGRLDVQGHKHCQSNNDLVNNCPTIFENPGLHKNNSRSPPRIRNSESAGSLGNFETSSFRNSQKNFSSPNVSQSLKVSGHHSPPERDRPSKVDGELRHLQHFVYPDPLIPLPVERDFRLVAYSDDCGPLKCKAPTAFIVDLQEIDGDDNSQCRITVKTSLRQFLPPRCERSLQRRLSWMKQNRKPHSATERSEGRTENEMVAADPRQRFRLSQSSSFKDSFEEAVANDAIADDVSEAGTYTIDVSSDGESVAVADARERILATFGITGIEDEDLEKAEWPESGKGYFEKDWDKDCSKKEESVKSKTNRRPTTLSDNSNISDSRSNGADPVTPTAESYTWSFSEVFTPPQLSKNNLAAQDDIMLTIYTETAAGCTITSSDTQPEYHEKNLHQEVKDPSRRLRILDRAVLVADTEWSSKSCESWPTESTLDTGHPMLDQKTVASSSHTSTKPSNSGAEACLPLENNKAGAFLSSTSTAASESGRIVLPTDRDYFKIPASSYSGPVSSLKIGVRAGGINDTEILDPRVTLRRKSTPASESGDSLESPINVTTASESLMFAEQTSRTDASSNKKSLFSDSEKDRDGAVRTECNELPTKAVGHHSCGNSMDGKSDSDEDGSSVDPRDGLVPARTVSSRTTEVTPKPTEDFVEVLVSQKTRTTRKSVEESRRASHQSTATESESPATRGEISAKKTLTSSSGQKTQITSPITEKPVASRHPKTKPPTPKSFPKSPSFPDGQLSSRRCFSDLDVADHDETSSETASPLVSEGKGTGGKGTSNSSVEHTRMNRTFALRCARREASDGTDAHRSDNAQRSTRTAKKSSSSKFDDVQRSRSASRSRPGGASPRSLFESSRSADTSVNVGQRVVRKIQENDKKTRQTSTTDSNTFTRSLTRDDDSSSQKSAGAFRPPNATRTAKKKNLASDRGKEDTVDGASGVTVKGSPVQSRPLSSSLPVQEAAANEWTRRKKYNPRQSLQTEVSLKKTGKPDGKPVVGNVDKTESRPRNRKKVADSSGKNAPSTPSDWTDDEKLQLTPRGRDLPAVCQLSAKVKLLSDQVLQSLRKRPEFKVNEVILQSPKQASSDTDSLENTSPEFLYIFHNLEAAERQMSAVFKVLSTHN